MKKPVFVCTGFLDSGKTTLIRETLMEQEWMEKGRTLLILCEEGEVSYPEAYKKEKEITLVRVRDFSELTPEMLKKWDRKQEPVQVILEFNGMWSLKNLTAVPFPENWELQGVYSTVNGQTLQPYLDNMRNLLMEQLLLSDLVVVNRCGKEVNRSGFRRAVRIQNPATQVIFEDLDGKIIQETKEDLPYRTDGSRIVVEDDDFGIWYADAYDHPERYQDKEIEFTAQSFRTERMAEGIFAPVRKIMTCCAADVRFYGYPCRYDRKVSIKNGKWVRVRVRYDFQPTGEGGQYQPILHLLQIKPARKPEQEVVYLG
ncbi:GTP-binding protein [Suipraeoptans intestinalis]|uniref:TIGR03943 family putative permease subunit n=1 Tax=Suipraeoptans intestinalis TaxID=2606628 RepID=UPI0023F1EA97|nr:GTP-binding protein [Suipraeoptans intestinalis]MDD7770493.1 GTP-binding protein [Suipraeoptans intestinalis]